MRNIDLLPEAELLARGNVKDRITSGALRRFNPIRFGNRAQNLRLGRRNAWAAK